jgi:hypothetical protein
MPIFEEEEGSSISLILLDNMGKMGYKYIIKGCCPNPRAKVFSAAVLQSK